MENVRKFIKVKEEHIVYNLGDLRQLVFEVTDSCNLCCSYCAYSDIYKTYGERGKCMMSFSMAKTVIDYLSIFWKEHSSNLFPKRFNIGFYGGEPLMNFSLIRQIVEYSKILLDSGRVLTYSMTTNALLIDKYINYLADNNFSILISLDGDEYAQGYRVDKSGKNSFQKVFANVKYIQSHYPDYFKEKVNFNAVLHSRNDIESICDFFMNNFSKKPQISPLADNNVNRHNLNRYNELCNSYYGSFIKAKNKEKLIDEDISFSPEIFSLFHEYERKSGNVYYDYNDLLYDKANLGVFPTGTCLPFGKKMFVTVDGKILQCEKISHKYTMGKVTDFGVKIDLAKIVKKYNTRVFRLIKLCHTCAYYSQCYKCMNMVDSGKDIVCNSYSESQTINLHLLRNMPSLLGRFNSIKTTR